MAGLALLAGFAGFSTASQAAVHGKVIDASTGEPLVSSGYGTIQLLQCDYPGWAGCSASWGLAYIAKDGTYTITPSSAMGAGTFVLSTSINGYGYKTTAEFTMSSASEDLKKNVKVKPYPVVIEDLVDCSGITAGEDCTLTYTVRNTSDKDVSARVWAHISLTDSSQVGVTAYDWGDGNAKPMVLKLGAGESQQVVQTLPFSKALKAGDYGNVRLYVSNSKNQANTVGEEDVGDFSVAADATLTLTHEQKLRPELRPADREAGARKTAALPAIGNIGYVSGTVTDGSTGDPVTSMSGYIYLYQCAAGEVDCSNYVTYTAVDSTGSYQILNSNLNAGTYQLHINSVDNYSQELSKPFDMSPGDKVTKNLVLDPRSLQFSNVSGCGTLVEGTGCTLTFDVTNISGDAINAKVWANISLSATGSQFGSSEFIRGAAGNSNPGKVSLEAGETQHVTMDLSDLGDLNVGTSLSVNLLASKKNTLNNTLGESDYVILTTVKAPAN